MILFIHFFIIKFRSDLDKPSKYIETTRINQTNSVITINLLKFSNNINFEKMTEIVRQTTMIIRNDNNSLIKKVIHGKPINRYN